MRRIMILAFLWVCGNCWAQERCVILDPGYGGSQFGATYGNLKAKNLNLKLAFMVGEILVERGMTVYVTRGDDVGCSLQKRVELAHNAKAELFVSIHTKFAQSNTAEVFHFLKKQTSWRSIQLANNISSNLCKTCTSNAGEADLYVLRETKMPAVLLELSLDLRVVQEDYLEKIAKAVADGFNPISRQKRRKKYQKSREFYCFSVQEKKFIRALVEQESGGDYFAKNRRVGALGKYQIMPQNLIGWGKYAGKKNFGWDYDALGYDITPQQFLRSPHLQDRIFVHKIKEFYDENLERARGNHRLAAVYTARQWYSNTWTYSDRRPTPHEPSPNEYARSILRRMERDS